MRLYCCPCGTGRSPIDPKYPNHQTHAYWTSDATATEAYPPTNKSHAPSTDQTSQSASCRRPRRAPTHHADTNPTQERKAPQACTAHGDQTIVLRPVRRIVMRARPRVRIVLAVHRNGTARTPANTLVRPAHGNEMITLRHIRRIEMLTRVTVIQTIHRHRRARRRPDRNRHARQRNQREHRRHTRGPPPSIPLHDTGTPPRNRKGRTRPERRARPNGKERGRNYLADTAYQPTPSARQPTETRRSFSDPSAV